MRFGLLPGQPNHTGPSDISFEDLDAKLNSVNFNPLPLTLETAQTHPPNYFEGKISLQKRNEVVTAKGNGLGWLIAILLTILSSLLSIVFVLGFTRIPEYIYRKRYGKRGGGAAEAFLNLSLRCRALVRRRSLHVVRRLKRRNVDRYNENHLKKMLTECDYTATQWLSEPFDSEDVLRLIADQNVFLAAFETLFSGDSREVQSSLTHLESLFFKYLGVVPSYFDVLKLKAAQTVAVSVSEPFETPELLEREESPGVTDLQSFCSRYSLVDLNEASFDELVNLSLTKIAFSREDVAFGDAYCNTLRGIAYICNLVGTQQFSAFYMAYKGPDYPALVEAQQKHKEALFAARNEAVSGGSKSEIWRTTLEILLFVSLVAGSFAICGKVVKFFSNFFGSGGNGGLRMQNLLSSRLQHLKDLGSVTNGRDERILACLESLDQLSMDERLANLSDPTPTDLALSEVAFEEQASSYVKAADSGKFFSELFRSDSVGSFSTNQTVLSPMGDFLVTDAGSTNPSAIRLDSLNAGAPNTLSIGHFVEDSNVDLPYTTNSLLPFNDRNSILLSKRTVSPASTLVRRASYKRPGVLKF